MLLSHTLMCSTIAAGALNYRVREGNVCFISAMGTGKKIKEEIKVIGTVFDISTIVELTTFFTRFQMKRCEKRWLSLTAD